MATITPGTGGTINATTIEGQVWQLLHLIQNGERSTEEERFTFAKDDTFIMTGNWSLPATFTRDIVTGLFTDTAAPYQPGGIVFTPGTNPTIKGLSLSQYFLDCIKYVMIWQNSGVKNPQTLKRFSLIFNADNLEYSGTFQIPYTAVLGAGGGISESATEWLIT